MSTRESGNPYQSPLHTEPPARLLPAHRAALMFYWEHREQPPTLSRFFVQYRRVWLLTVLICLVAFVLLLLFTQDLHLAIVGSFIILVASLARDLMHMRAAIGFWPVFSQVLAWDKVKEKLLDENA
jgi:hypothetical protein